MMAFNRGYAVVVGVANYPHFTRLPSPILQDAQDIGSLLQEENYCGYPAAQVRVLLDSEATAVRIREGLQWLADHAGEGDTAVFFFSGHGGRMSTGSATSNFLLAYDTHLTNLHDTAISGAELTGLLQQVRADRLLVLFDCCHAGGIGEAKSPSVLSDFKTGLDEQLYEQLGQGQGRAIITSSRADELSWLLPGMVNSLFTHYLLEALRGAAPTRGDGMVRLFDVFDYVSGKVRVHEPRQQPLLKAEVETNFPIALHLGGQKTMVLHIETAPDIDLSTQADAILRMMFADYERLVVKKEFGRGFSGGRVFLVRPIRRNHPDLPAVVKMGSAALITQEWNAFQAHIRYRLPSVANVEGEPVYTNDGKWGGLRYPFVGADLYQTDSLLAYAQTASTPEIQYALNDRLFKNMGQLWGSHTLAPEFSWRESYDAILPVNIIITASSLPPTVPVRQLSPQTILTMDCRVGDFVSISGFCITEVNPDRYELTLNLAGGGCYRIRVQAVIDIAAYQENRMLTQPLTGTVIGTRQTQLQQLAASTLSDQVNLAAATVYLPDGTAVPNPLHCLPDILRMSKDVRIGPVHGDLNLENVLVEYDQGSCNINLIDFACARQDHVLHDFLRLETGFLLYLLPQAMMDAGLTLADLRPFLAALHGAMIRERETAVFPTLEKLFTILSLIRRRARQYLHMVSDWSEYYYGLTLYLLGALKFKNLDSVATTPRPKEIAFWGAAIVQHFLHNPPELAPPEPAPITKQEKTAAVAVKEGQMVSHQFLLQLFDVLDKQLSQGELQTLCFRLDIEYSDLPGETRFLKIQEMLRFLNRRHRIPELMIVINEVNTAIVWPKLPP